MNDEIIPFSQQRELIQMIWRTQLLLLLSQGFVWLLETLRTHDGVEQLQNLKEPLWLMTGLCIVAALMPTAVSLLDADSAVLCAMLVAIVWSLLFAVDLIMEWRKQPSGNVRTLMLVLNLINLFNAVYSFLWWYRY